MQMYNALLQLNTMNIVDPEKRTNVLHQKTSEGLKELFNIILQITDRTNAELLVDVNYGETEKRC